MLLLRVDGSDMMKEEIVASEHSVQIEEKYSSHH
jgi:hypothetical protein